MAEQDGYLYDLFISYSPADRELVEGYLLDALNAANVRVLSELNFALGTPRLIEFERAVKSSKRTLLVLSPAYMAEGALQFVDVMVQAYGLESGTWPVIPLLLKSVELPPRLAFLVPLDATDPQDWADAITRLCSALQAGPPAPAARPRCPYPGMRAFREQEAPCFHGREAKVDELVQRLRRHPFVAVIGPSGSGKSSLVNAGLIPALQRSALFGEGGWLVRTVRPGAQPMAELALALDSADIQQFAPSALLATQPGTARLLLVVDQFEEIFTQGGAQKEAFFAAMRRFVSLPDCYAVITARADFFADLLTSTLWPAIQAHHLEIAPLGEQGLRVAIVKPAEEVGVFVESALVERLAAGSAGQPGVLPFVQEVMVRLWEKLERRYLPLRAYEALVLPLANYSGSERTGIQAAMAQLADDIIEELSPEQQRIAKRIFLRLVQFGEGRPDTRRRQTEEALARASGDDPTLFAQTLAHLTESQLLTTSGVAKGGARRVDIAHEALITGWQLLKDWLDQYRAAEQTKRQLDAKAAEWVRTEKRSGLLDAYELEEAQKWLDGDNAQELGCSLDLLNLVAASKAALEKEEAEKEEQRQREIKQAQKLAEEQRLRAEEGEKAARELRRRFRFAVTAAVLALVLLGVAGLAARLAMVEAANARAAEVTAVANAAEAQRQKQNAQRNESVALVEQARNSLPNDALASLDYSARALPGFPDSVSRPYVPEAEFALTQALRANLEEDYQDISSSLTTADQVAFGSNSIAVGGDALSLVSYDLESVTPLTKTTDLILGVEWQETGDNRNLLLSYDENGVRVWESGTDGMRQVVYEPFASPCSSGVPCAGWRPKHQDILLSSGESTYLWTLANGKTKLPLNLPNQVWGFDWSTDGVRLAAWDIEGNLSLCDTTKKIVYHCFCKSVAV